MSTAIEFWIIFNAAVVVLLVLDLSVFHRHARASTPGGAALATGMWVSLSLVFNVVIWHWKGKEKAIEFLTGYLVEYSLSIDNIFVFVLVFSYFAVPAAYQYRVLFWGILGALIMRGLMIWLGVTLISQFHWMIYLFGAFLVFTGFKMLFGKDEELNPERNPIVLLSRRFLPVTKHFEESRFAVRCDGRWMLTPLAIVLLVVESTDLLFAVDSIPAIIAITKDPFIVYTSNVCAILGLRSLYFLLASVVPHFVYLKTGLAVILCFIGTKMLLSGWFHIPTLVSLGVVAGCLLAAVVASLIFHRRKKTE